MIRKILSAAAAAAVVFATAISPEGLSAQQPPRSAPPAGVAIIDLSFVFKNHPGFQRRIEVLKTEVEAREADLRAVRDRIRTKAESLRDFQPSSADFKKLEAELTQMQADLQVQLQLQKKEFLERESKIYYEHYKEISDVVKFFAERNNIATVIRFNRDTADSADPSKVMQELNKVVVYHHPGIDITDIILEQVKRQAAVAGPGPGAPAGGAAAPRTGMVPGGVAPRQ